MDENVIPLFKEVTIAKPPIVAEAYPLEEEEKTGPLTHDQINMIHELTGELANTNDPDYVVELMGRIRSEVNAWPDG